MSEENLQDVFDMVREAYAPTADDQNRVYHAVIAAPLLAAGPVLGKGGTFLTVVKGIGATVLALALGLGIYMGMTDSNRDDTDNQALRASDERPNSSMRARPETELEQSIRHPRAVGETEQSVDSHLRGTDESQKAMRPGQKPMTANDGNEDETRKTPAKSAKSSGHNRQNKRPDNKAASESSNPLAQEIALVRDAAAAINAGKMKRARRLLNTHRAQFQNGVMVQERNGLEIIALCKQGKMTAAARRFDGFKKMSPNAPIIIRIHKTCEFQ